MDIQAHICARVNARLLKVALAAGDVLLKESIAQKFIRIARARGVKG